MVVYGIIPPIATYLPRIHFQSSNYLPHGYVHLCSQKTLTCASCRDQLIHASLPSIRIPKRSYSFAASPPRLQSSKLTTFNYPYQFSQHIRRALLYASFPISGLVLSPASFDRAAGSFVGGDRRGGGEAWYLIRVRGCVLVCLILCCVMMISFCLVWLSGVCCKMWWVYR